MMGTFLLDLFPGKLWIYVAALASAFAAGGGVAWTVQGYRLDAAKSETSAVQAKFDGFVATQKTIGEAAQAAANEKTRIDNAAKRRIDDASKTDLDKFRADIKRLRDATGRESPGRYFVPQGPASAGSADRACYDGNELESAIRGFDQSVQGLVDKGSTAIIKLNKAKEWAVP